MGVVQQVRLETDRVAHLAKQLGRRELLHRFENPSLGHRTQQIAMDGTQKVAVRWLPALRESLARGLERPFLERALAAWLHYLATGAGDRGQALVINDPGADPLIATLRAARDPESSVRAVLDHHQVFGREPWPDEFVERVARHLAALRRGGTAALLSPSTF